MTGCKILRRLCESESAEQSKETLRAELGRRKLQSKMGPLGRWRKGTEFERSSPSFLNTSMEASVAVKLVEGWGAECKRARGRRSFAGEKILESESDLSR